MAMNTAAISADFEIGRVVSRMFQVIGDNTVTFLALAVLASIPSMLFTFIGAAGTSIRPQIGSTGILTPALPVIVSGVVLGFLVFIVVAYLLQAAMVYGTISALNGRKASFMDCLATGIRNAVPLTIIALLAVLSVGIGFLLLIVPGMILVVMWSVLTPVRVAERTGILDTFSRSAALTKGHRGAIFGLFVIYMVLAGALGLIIRPLTGLSLMPVAGMHIPMTYVIATGLVRVATSLIGATGIASIYYELRMVKEGIGPEQLAAVFE